MEDRERNKGQKKKGRQKKVTIEKKKKRQTWSWTKQHTQGTLTKQHNTHKGH